jgi:3-ketosteroid 9alpha-monooxygenase subunit B
MAVVAEAPPSRRIKELEVMVADVVVETPDTSTLVFFTGNDRLEYRAGHFLTIDPHQFEALERFTAFLEDLKGKRELPRAYSMCSAPHERYLAVTVKEEQYVSGTTKYPPLLSPLLVKRTVRGMRLKVTGFTGPYTLSDDVESQTDHIVHICAGSGSVPNFSMLKFALQHHPRLRHTFIYSNKTWGDVIFRDALTELEAKNPDRLRVIHTLTREPDVARCGPLVRKGRVNAVLIRELAPDVVSSIVYVCGPGISKWDREAAKEKGESPQPRFLETVLTDLLSLGVPNARIKRESYG